MGLTGIILDATFRLIPIETSRMSVETRRIGHLDEIMARMAATDAGVRYSVAWIDLLATGRHLGRGVLTNADHARHEQLDPAALSRPLAYDADPLIAVPPLVPARWCDQPAARSLRSTSCGTARRPVERHGELQSIPAYFHPLDLVGELESGVRAAGLPPVPVRRAVRCRGALRTVIERISAARLPIFLTVLKRFGAGNAVRSAFPMGGWTLAIDVGVTHRTGLADLLRSLDTLVLDAGGRHYLAKDFQMTPAEASAGAIRGSTNGWPCATASTRPASGRAT